MSRLLLVDDHVLLLDTLRDYLTRSLEGMEIDTARTIAEAEAALARPDTYDLAIVDYRMPGSRGISTLRGLVENPCDIPVAVMSGQASAEDVRAILQQGAMGFIDKAVSGSSLTHAVRLMLSGERFIPASLLSSQSARRGSSGPGDDGSEPLPPKAMAVLRLLRQGRTNKEIGRELELEEVTIKLYIGRLAKRFGARNRVQVLMAAMEHGLLD
ncbi:MAG: response regulator transcription factor [Burkholderiales bacterium]|nr:response regulator transcription factor [Burkholderiales bacterium]MDE1929066.1 response regulator transcription factor [Burkholderiales bacterium]MDE2160948.1 response regulator transcription factor [Burkholderiales bacterium]MDE2502045.1 response regulator transcription factor [Burkholderiales bacterium]